MTQTELIIILVTCSIVLGVFSLGLLTGWMMGRRMLRSVMAAKDPTYTDEVVKGKDKMVSTHDDGRNVFDDFHIKESIPVAYDTLDDEKGGRG